MEHILKKLNKSSMGNQGENTMANDVGDGEPTSVIVKETDQAMYV